MNGLPSCQTTLWKTAEFRGEKIRYTLRRYVILVFHLTPLGGHQSRDRTYAAISDAGLYWPKMRTEIESMVRCCTQCALVKGRPFITGSMRSRESDGPFCVLVIDFVGPQSPATKGGNKCMFMCVCVFQGGIGRYLHLTIRRTQRHKYLQKELCSTLQEYLRCYVAMEERSSRRR